jgi:hypothetical protein
MRPGRVTLLAAVAALALVVLVRPPNAPPLYDGLGFPDEPYRWVTPPAGAAATAPATSATATLDLAGAGGSPAARAFSAEQGPQVAFALAAGALTVALATSQLTLTVTPAAPPAAPAGGSLASNLYRFQAAPLPLSAVRVAAGRQVVVNLRADQATSRTVVLETWDGRGWSQVATQQVGADIYAAQLSGLVPFALVRLDPGVPVTAAPAAPGPSGPAATGPSGPAAAAGGAGVAAVAAPTLATRDGGPSTGLWVGLAVLLALIAGGLALLRVRGGGTR